MQKQSILLSLLLAALVVGILLYPKHEPEAQSRTPEIPSIADRPSPPRGPGPLAKAKGPAPSGLLPVVTMQPVNTEPDASVRYQYRLDVPFRCHGGGGVGTIKDREGNILMESGEEIRIFGATLSPDDQRLLVNGASKNIVLNPVTGEKIPLPQKPPGEHMLGLSGWHWMSNDILVVDGGDEVIDERVRRVRPDDTVAQSRLYTYDLRLRELREVVLPEGIPVPVFTIKEASYDGHVNLISDSTPEGIDPDLGWFKIKIPQ